MILVDRKLRIEIEAGRKLRLFDSPPYDDMVMSPIGLHPKESGDFRLITHLSQAARHDPP